MQTWHILTVSVVACLGLASSVNAVDTGPGETTRILLIGDSLVAIHQGDARVENVMARQFEKMNRKGFKVSNLACGGMWIGPAETDASGISQPLLAPGKEGKDWYAIVRKRQPEAEIIIVEFGANDSKVYTPEVFAEKLAALCDKLEVDYPKVRIILSTGMWQDPTRSGRYWRTPSMVKEFKQGDNRNAYLAPYYEQIRKVAGKRGCQLADVCERFKAELGVGNWDVRVREKPDSELTNDIHPNERGTEIMADCYVQAILRTGRELVPFAKTADVESVK